MVLFKINGERNSGTNFLNKILQLNKFPTYEQKIIGKIVYHWKHGVPTNDYKNLNETVVDLFIFRDLNDWLISSYNNPYHLTPHKSFDSFLKSSQKSNTTLIDYRTNKIINDEDNGKTIFEIRYYKFNKIMEYKKNNKDVILINLSFIQNEQNLAQLLNFLADKYSPKLKVDNFICNIEHTKTKRPQKNRTYKLNVNDYENTINLYKNTEIEKFIDNLSYM